jgi:hypothetical protein
VTLRAGTTSGTIMTERRLAKIVRQIEALRARGGVSGAELEQLLRKLGRHHDGNGVWRSAQLGGDPITVHTHSGDLSRFTKNDVLRALLEDVAAWRNTLDEAAKNDQDQDNRR